MFVLRNALTVWTWSVGGYIVVLHLFQTTHGKSCRLVAKQVCSDYDCDFYLRAVSIVTLIPADKLYLHPKRFDLLLKPRCNSQ